MKKYNEDLNTTLTFVGLEACNGGMTLMLKTGRLFSAVISTFIAQVQPELQPDPNDETVTLLRVLIHKIDNTTFGDAPALPQLTGPPRAIVQVRCLFYASLAASIFSAFLVVLGKQWLNRYASVICESQPLNAARLCNGSWTGSFCGTSTM